MDHHAEAVEDHQEVVVTEIIVREEDHLNQEVVVVDVVEIEMVIEVEIELIDQGKHHF